MKHAAHGHGQGHGQLPAEIGGGGAPVDIVETPCEYTFVLDIPSLSKSDIQVTLGENNVLVMKSASDDGGIANGKRKLEEEEGDCRYVRLERRASPRSFVRKFRLPEDAVAGALAARCENGVPTITIKKQPPPEKKTKSVQFTIA